MVKLYADEPGHELVRGLTRLTVSALARVEVVAAFWRKARSGDVGPGDAVTMTRVFESHLRGGSVRASRFATVPATTRVLDEAARLVPAHGLRAYDAVQLASAVTARAVDPEVTDFACFDAILRRAASATGFSVIPP